MNTFTACKVVRAHEKEEQEILNKTYNLDLMNTSGLEIFDVSYDGIRNIKDRILHIHRISRIMHDSIDYLFFVHLQQMGTYLPLSLFRSICSRFMSRVTIGITNLVGFNKSSYCGCSIDDILFHVPNIFQTGFILSIFSYADRMSVTLVSGKGYVHKREELQTILDSYFKYLDEAEKEVLGYR
ncbi:WS/DGAT C-terminal domain [Popillia japonica]|uniref:WS/DGAT C-terminal domain n=1 Tax=Popillia japonica TaxID=7064 RepID=A0AAW1IB02_POPJA